MRNMIYLPPKQDDEDDSENDPMKKKEGNQNVSQFPLFTDQVRLSVSKLLKLPRKKQVEMFFDKDSFKKLIGSSFTKDLDERNENAEHNLRTMLQILLPTIFPIRANMTETFSKNMKNIYVNIPNISKNTSVFTLLSDFIGKENDYGYLNLGKQYTVTKITFINDIINDPIFSNLIQPSINFQKWRTETIKKYKDSSEDLIKKITKTIQENYNNIRSSINDTNSDAFRDLEKVKNKNSSINRDAGHPPRLMTPYFEALLKTESTNISTIIDIFAELYKLNNAAPNDKPNYIPYSIKTLPGFNNLLEYSIKYKIDIEMKNTINNMEHAVNYLKKIKEKDKLPNYVEKVVSEKIKSFTHLETFIEMINKFRQPIRSYSNKQLSVLFNETSNNIQPFMEYIDFLREIIIEDKPEDKYLSNTVMIDKLKTGVMSVIENIPLEEKKDELLKRQTKAYYDCFINLELIDGLLNDENIDLIKCPYRNDFLVTIYNDLKTSENKNPLLFYNNLPVFEMAKYTKKKRSTNTSKKMKGGFIPRGEVSLASLSIKSADKKNTRKRRYTRRKKYSLRARNTI